MKHRTIFLKGMCSQIVVLDRCTGAKEFPLTLSLLYSAPSPFVSLLALSPVADSGQWTHRGGSHAEAVTSQSLLQLALCCPTPEGGCAWILRFSLRLRLPIHIVLQEAGEWFLLHFSHSPSQILTDRYEVVIPIRNPLAYIIHKGSALLTKP